MKLVIVEMENEEKQKTKETDVVKPYTIRILANDVRDSASQSRWRSFCDSKADKVIKFSEAEEYFKKYLKALKEDIKTGKRQVPKILKINLDAHGGRDGSIFMSNEKDTACSYIYILGTRIRELLKMGVKKVYIKTSPCYGGCYFDASGEKKSVFQIIKRAIQYGGTNQLDEKAEELINKVYCSTTRAGIGLWHQTGKNNHVTGYSRDKTIPWYQKLRYRINEFFWFFSLPFDRSKQGWFADMSRPKRNAMGFLIGSEGRIYFPLRDADKFTYDEYFTKPKNAKKLHIDYSGPRAKEYAYRFLGLGNINNKKAKNYLGDDDIWKSYYTSGWSF